MTKQIRVDDLALEAVRQVFSQSLRLVRTIAEECDVELDPYMPKTATGPLAAGLLESAFGEDVEVHIAGYERHDKHDNDGQAHFHDGVECDQSSCSRCGEQACDVGRLRVCYVAVLDGDA